jgi:aspartate aminotransferase-like enzyme
VFADAFQAGIKALGLDSYPEKGHNAHTLTVPKIPEGVDDAKMRSIMNQKHRVIIAGGLGKLGGKTVRVGHMGSDTSNDVIATIAAIEMALAEMGHHDDVGAGMGAAMKPFIEA